MTLNDVREALYEAAARFFPGADVRWANQVGTQAKPPYLTLRMGDVERRLFTVHDREDNRRYPCATTLAVNLYTQGRPLDNEEGVTGNFINTAVSDLMEFAAFLESEGMVDFFAARGVCVLLQPPVRDLTELENDRKYRYRAMAEFAITFQLAADGWYALLDVPANDSGGGTEETAMTPIEPIEDFEPEVEEYPRP